MPGFVMLQASTGVNDLLISELHLKCLQQLPPTWHLSIVQK